MSPTSTTTSNSRRRRRISSYGRLEAEKKAETRKKYITAGILGLIVTALLASLGVIAFGMTS